MSGPAMTVLQKPLIISMSLAGTIFAISLIDNIFISPISEKPWYRRSNSIPVAALCTITFQFSAFGAYRRQRAHAMTLTMLDIVFAYSWGLVWLLEVAIAALAVVHLFSLTESESTITMNIFGILIMVMVLGEAGTMWYIAIKGHGLFKRCRGQAGGQGWIVTHP